jgi:NAD+ kinase
MLINRGLSPFLCHIDFYVDNILATRVLADGIIVSTTTGSTAYSMSAGGAIAPPTLPGILVTPICPHSLSFRPIMLPDNCELKFEIPTECVDGASLCFDGRPPRKLEVGDYITVTKSTFPFPCVNLKGTHREWFSTIKSKLGWNIREVNQR